jgi:hypothetical protein
MHYRFPKPGEMMRQMDRMLSIQATDGPLDVHITETWERCRAPSAASTTPTTGG